jgi:hypothetical protein
MKVGHAGVDHNTEAISWPCEHGNVYFGCTKVRKFFPYCAINQNYEVDWGTAPQSGRSPLRFPVGYWDFSLT